MAVIGFLCSDPTGAVAHYRAALPANVLRARGHTVVVSDQGQLTPAGTIALALNMPDDPYGRAYAWEPDVVVLTHGWVSGAPLEMIAEARASGQVVVADVDDWPWLEVSNPHHDVGLPEAKAAGIAASNALVVSTEVLANGLAAYARGPVEVAHNMIDLDLYAKVREQNVARRRRYGDVNPQPLTIAWRGGVNFHVPDLELLGANVSPALRAALEAGRVRFLHVGDIRGARRFAEVVGVSPRSVKVRQHSRRVVEYPPLLLGADLAIVPLASNAFARSKSAIAGMEWAAAGVPFIASDHPAYATAFDSFASECWAVDDPTDWSARILELAEGGGHARGHLHATEALRLEQHHVGAHVDAIGNVYESLFASLGVADPYAYGAERGPAPAQAGAGHGGGARPEGQTRTDPQRSHTPGDSAT